MGEKCCGTCKWSEVDECYGLICRNCQSTFHEDFVDFEDDCVDYEEDE